MTCPANIKVRISQDFVLFPHHLVEPQRDVGGALVTDLVVYTPTVEDRLAVNTQLLMERGFTNVKVRKHSPRYETEPKSVPSVVVYWNAIIHIHKTGVGNTHVFNVVLGDNLYECGAVSVDEAPESVRCPVQINFAYFPMVPRTLVNGNTPADSEQVMLLRSPDRSNFVVTFRKDTPLGIKILNIKRIQLILATRRVPALYAINIPHEELVSVHRELSWENTRRMLRGARPHRCGVVAPNSLKYVMDAMELLDIGYNDVNSVHTIVRTFSPLILDYKLVPDVFIELNRITGDKHVRLYCDADSLAITNAGQVPLNMPTVNPKPLRIAPPPPPSEQFYQSFGTRDIYVGAPHYNYFL